jgi:hypothetical protein
MLALAACATPAPDLERMSTAEVCYLGLTQRDKGPVAGAEIQRRNEDCINHVGELAQMADYDVRARGAQVKDPNITPPHRPDVSPMQRIGGGR